MKQEIVMYTLPLCPYCARAKRFLTGRGIMFVEKNILIPKNLKELRKVTNLIGVPVTIVGKQILTRFSLKEYEEVFKN
ncbi:glutaredoxin family protein [Desulfosporosinus hippei]|uniref:Glutaredoxin n=1 Tax=Desulfosporosinus hippei DSM 8344 TaxID=1121419 RepID=A0A1G7TH54_9FIRM|nr:glutaredoxin family protein [Desulfosporosinus hippei]SDG34648.1 Glutaredoxin [Desulfosporosinus hippei DSM 8344]